MTAFSQWLGWNLGAISWGSQLFFMWPVHIVSPPWPLMCPLSPTGASGHPCSGVAGVRRAKEDLPGLLRARPGTGRITASCWLESSPGCPDSVGVSWQVWLDGRDCWQPSSESVPTPSTSVLPVWNHPEGFPRSLTFPFPNEFLV